MGFLIDFFRQKAPESKKEMPAYYQKALVISEGIFAAYFLANVLLLAWATKQWEWLPIAVFAILVGCPLSIKKMSARVSLALFAATSFIWCGWYILSYGWGCGSQNLLFAILALAFFNVFEPPWAKIAYTLILIVYRISLFSLSLRGSPMHDLDATVRIVLQVSNSVVLLLTLTLEYILFSTNTQDTERQLRINNQELHKEAGTDPLTQLPNRRAMMDLIDRYQKEAPDTPFGVAIADIDFFKKVNDTYGHHCGDYTLKALADLFRECAKANYSVCRWGGEEFCFFMPGLNLDQSTALMTDLNVAVSRMKLSYADHDYSITITIGVEENDFHSTISEILDRADRKLYMGKVHGRNQVVM